MVSVLLRSTDTMITTTRLLPLVLLVAGTSCGSSDHPPPPDSGPACTELGCGPSLRVRFVRPSWPAATYRIQVVADGAEGSCSVAVPLGCSTAPQCMGLLDFAPETSGCGQDPSLHSIVGLAFTRTTPAAVMVRVLQGETELGSGSYTPTYTMSRPNGPSCQPECESAPSPTLTLTP
jgi:hypothetical protein